MSNYCDNTLITNNHLNEKTQSRQIMELSDWMVFGHGAFWDM